MGDPVIARSRRIGREETLRTSFAYLWPAADQLRLCRQAYRCDFFLPEVLQRIYRSLLVAGQSPPFPAVAYLAFGYTLHRIYLRDHAPDEARQYVNVANRWLSESLQYEKMPDRERYNWVALEQFMHRCFSEIALAASRNSGRPPLPSWDWMPPAICDSNKLLKTLADVEARLVADPTQTPFGRGDEITWRRARLTGGKALAALADQISEALRPQPRGSTAHEEHLRQAAEQQAKAVHYYLGRAGVDPCAGALSRPEYGISSAPAPREQILDLHALAGYQTYGRFMPDAETQLLLEQLRRRRSDPIVTRQSQEASVEGTTRRGRITQLLKWQLALPEEYRYDRFFNNKMLYLKRISEKSRDIYVTFLLIIDLSAPANSPVLEGSRRHSVARETGAHFLQDCYQVLYQVPRLYVDAIVVMHDGQKVVWEGMLLLSDGTQNHPTGVREDLFLQDRPLWLPEHTAFADPTTYFHFHLPALNVALQSRDDDRIPLEDQCVGAVRRMRRDRAVGTQLRRTRESTQVMPVALSDLMVTVVAPASHLSDREAVSWLDPVATLALEHRLWVCECGFADEVDRQIDLRLFTERTTLWCDWQSLSDFQRQVPTQRSSPPTGLRQAFVQGLLHTLLDLYVDAEAG